GDDERDARLSNGSGFLLDVPSWTPSWSIRRRLRGRRSHHGILVPVRLGPRIAALGLHALYVAQRSAHGGHDELLVPWFDASGWEPAEAFRDQDAAQESVGSWVDR